MVDKGIIFDIQKFSLHDGPGIRTTVFLKGCNMRCVWCHNPESFNIKPQLYFEAKSCVGCRACEHVCVSNVHKFDGFVHKVDFSACITCGKCVSACMYNALKIVGKEMCIDEIMREIKSDIPFYESSGGGVTFSGGEPTFQKDFLKSLLLECKSAGIHTCVETNGFNTEAINEIAEFVDLFLLDFKHYDNDEHIKYTGFTNHNVINTLALLDKLKASVILRCPIIPNVNDNEVHYKHIIELKNKYSCVESYEYMKYHELGLHKWDSLGLKCKIN